jgi:hypothetical protein
VKPTTIRLLTILFIGYVALTAVHIAYVVNHEPYAFDAWNVSIDTGAKAPSISRFFAFWHQQYTSSNPRIGQPLAYLAYKLVGVGEIGTVFAFFAIVLGCFVLGTGRLPSWRSGRDQATLALGIGLMWFAAPMLPSYMFCRAYATNYVWSAAIQLWFLVPLRLYAHGNEPDSVFGMIGYFALGLAAGMGNEHVGPTMLLFLLVFTVWMWRTQHRLSRFVVAGMAGAFIGYALLFFAPGQGQRYDSIGEHYSVLQQIKVRGLAGNMDIFMGDLTAAAPLLIVLLMIVAVGLIAENRIETDLVAARDQQRRALAHVGLCLFAGMLITITVFASPKLGPRFYVHSMLLLLSGVMAVSQSFLYRARSFAPFVVLAAIASTYAAARTVPLYTRLSRDSDARLAQLEATPPGGITTLQAWEQIPEEWWFMGDDVRDQKKQELIAKYFGLYRVLFRGNDQWSTLGVTDVKLTMHYDFDQPVCLDEVDGLDLKAYVGRDVGAIHHAFLDAITEIQRMTSGRHLRSIDLIVNFLGEQPPLPRKTLYVARWREGVLEGYTASMRRRGQSHDREIELPAALRTSDWDIYVTGIGDPPKLLGKSTSRAPLVYVPWKSGPYWVTACKPDFCFVIFTVSHAV